MSVASPLRLLITGFRGRMGKAVAACAQEDPQFKISAQISAGEDFSPALAQSDITIDFTHADATWDFVRASSAADKPIVIGTTGQTEKICGFIRQEAKRIPIVFAPNFSIGVNTLFWLTKKAAEILGPSFDLEVLEMHHRNKKDAPSGTALRLAEILAAARSLKFPAHLQHGRQGMVGPRPREEIGMHSLRGGDVVGDHTVLFSSEGERVELTHKASSRETFARGALRAAAWAVGQPPGLYDMEDVLGLK